MTVWKTYDLHPDGVRIQVNWDKMVIGASVFIPCINTEEAIKQSIKIFADRGWTLDHRVRIEGGNLGLRIWRTV
jgi:hypothetical protein